MKTLFPKQYSRCCSEMDSKVARNILNHFSIRSHFKHLLHVVIGKFLKVKSSLLGFGLTGDVFPAFSGYYRGYCNLGVVDHLKCHNASE